MNNTQADKEFAKIHQVYKVAVIGNVAFFLVTLWSAHYAAKYWLGWL